jgi:hypothetical protein
MTVSGRFAECRFAERLFAESRSVNRRLSTKRLSAKRHRTENDSKCKIVRRSQTVKSVQWWKQTKMERNEKIDNTIVFL